jgi:hypothetical protein|tara:strand:+ start:3796 stop:4221 length:426 start_codon:yes stop_codon:yes gene_type:complete
VYKMPRSNKTQPAAAVKGQQYGEKKEQLDAQSQMPLPSIEGSNISPNANNAQSSMGPKRSKPVVGQGFGPSERPNEVITQTSVEELYEGVEVNIPPERSQTLAPVVHQFLALANNVNSDPDLQRFVRRIQNFIPTKYDESQ